MKITAIRTGTIETWMHLLSGPLTCRPGIRIAVPVSCYLIEYDSRKILFDAGQLPLDRSQDPFENFVVKVSKSETVRAQLEEMKVTASDIDCIVLSHLHADHAAGIADFPQTQLVIQQSGAVKLKNIPNPVKFLDGAYDLFQDGRVVCIPTPGHTAEHQSLLVSCDNGEKLLLVGDAVYFPEALDYEADEAEYTSRQAYFDSIKLLRKMRSEGVRLCFGHTPYSLL